MKSKRPRKQFENRRGSILVLSAILMVVMMAFIALSVDVGYMNNVKTEMDRAVDAGALAGASALPTGQQDAELAARSIVAMNLVGNSSLSGEEVDVILGHWDVDQRVFTPDSNSPSAVKVTAQRPDQPLFFANVLGHSDFSVQSSAIALFEPRDIMIVLDYSGSMNDDSELRSIDYDPLDSYVGLPRSTVEANLAQIYSELGSPSFGSMVFAPTWMNVPGQAPQNSYQPQIHVEHRYDRVFITSTKPFDRVRVYRSSSTFKTFNGDGTYNSSEGVWERELTYDDWRRIYKVKVRSGYWTSDQSSSNKYEETFDFGTSTNVRSAARKAWGLNAVSYPFSGGSWNEYIDYCCDNSNKDSREANENAGYKYKFGYMNFTNYLLEKRSSYSNTPVLWQCTEQPITAVKNSVDVFLNLMQGINGGDHIGLAVYNSSSGYGKLEQGLTPNFGIIGTLSRERQSNHYHSMTNIAAGLDTARNELVNNGRPNVVRRIVLMTDGVPTWPDNESYARNLAIQAAQDCADEGIQVATISLGSGADVPLMAQIADMTAGGAAPIKFVVEGGRPIAEIEQELRDVFQWVASARPLRLVSGGGGE